MSKARAPDDLAQKIFQLVMAGVVCQIVVMLWIGR